MKKRAIVRYSILSLSITFVFLGIIREEHETVIIKAINVCLECIGIG